MSASNVADQAVGVNGETPVPKMGLIGYLKQHPKGFWFIFWGEFAERCSYYGMRAILALYMVDQLDFTKAKASTAMHAFIAGCYLLPLIGGWVADNFFGKYWARIELRGKTIREQTIRELPKTD